MSRQMIGHMTDIRLTCIDLWWPQNFAFWNICFKYIKKAEHLRISYLTNVLLFLIILPLMTLNWPLMTLIDLQTSIIVNITITEKIGMLHIKGKLKTAVLQRKYGQVNLRTKGRPTLTYIDLWGPQDLGF